MNPPAAPSVAGLRGPLVAVAGFLAACDLGLFSEVDGLVVAALLVAARPALAPWLLLAAVSIQDARGLASAWSYPCLAVIGAGLAWHAWSTRRLPRAAGDPAGERLLALAGAALVVVGYGLAASLAQQHLGGAAQAQGLRSPWTLAALMGFNVVAGLLAWQAARRREEGLALLRAVALLVLANGMLVLLAQAWGGLELVRSSGGYQQVLGVRQLAGTTAVPAPLRLTGTYLSPNGFAQCMAGLLLLAVAANGRAPLGRGAAWGYAGLGAALTLATQGKTLGAFLALTAVIGLSMAYRDSRKVLLAAGAAALVAGLAVVLVDPLRTAFRVPDTALWAASARGRFWQLLGASLGPEDWLLGTGLAHWPLLSRDNLLFEDFAASFNDPHSWVLSIPGDFGLLGLVFYGALALALGLAARRAAGCARFVALALFAKFFLHDLMAVPYVLASAPLALMNWLTLGLVLGAAFPPAPAAGRAAP